jgi:hypothetical protein
MAGSGLSFEKDYKSLMGLLKSDLENLKHAEESARENVSWRLDRFERLLLQAALERREVFQTVIFKDGKTDRALCQIQPFFYFYADDGGDGVRLSFYATKGDISEDFYEFSNLIPFSEHPEVREIKLLDPEFHRAILGITPAS